jgi:flagellar hook-length control protein FliK
VVNAAASGQLAAAVLPPADAANVAPPHERLAAQPTTAPVPPPRQTAPSFSVAHFPEVATAVTPPDLDISGAGPVTREVKPSSPHPAGRAAIAAAPALAATAPAAASFSRQPAIPPSESGSPNGATLPTPQAERPTGERPQSARVSLFGGPAAAEPGASAAPQTPPAAARPAPSTAGPAARTDATPAPSDTRQGGDGGGGPPQAGPDPATQPDQPAAPPHDPKSASVVPSEPAALRQAGAVKPAADPEAASTQNGADATPTPGAQPAPAAAAPGPPGPAAPTPAGTQLVHTLQTTGALHVAPGTARDITIHLQPGTLGAVQVRIERGQDGAATITLQADKPDTLHALQLDAAHLHQALDRAGLPTAGRQMSFELAPQSTAGSVSGGGGGDQGGGQGGGQGTTGQGHASHGGTGQRGHPQGAAPAAPLTATDAAAIPAGISAAAGIASASINITA